MKIKNKKKFIIIAVSSLVIIAIILFAIIPLVFGNGKIFKITDENDPDGNLILLNQKLQADESLKDYNIT